MTAAARRSLALAAVCVAVAAPLHAEGVGLRVGDAARLHASVETEVRWDSMAGIGQFNGLSRGELVLNPADLVLHVRPGLRLEAPGAQSRLTGSAKLDVMRYAGLQADTSVLSYVGIAGELEAELGRGGPSGFLFSDRFSRSDRSTNPALGVGSVTDSNTAEGRLLLRPGGGALEASLGYAFTLEAYEEARRGALACDVSSCDGRKYAGFGSQTHKLSADARWRFFPKTALILEGSVAPRVYETAASNVSTATVRAMGGLAGLVTERVRLALKGGYANTLAEKGQNFSGFIGLAELGWDPRETVALSLGASRMVEPVSDVYAWYQDVRAWASATVQVLGKLQLSGMVAYDAIGFANAGRNDTQLVATAVAELEVHPMLRVAVGQGISRRDSTQGFAFSYTRSETFGRLTVAY